MGERLLPSWVLPKYITTDRYGKDGEDRLVYFEGKGVGQVLTDGQSRIKIPTREVAEIVVEGNMSPES